MHQVTVEQLAKHIPKPFSDWTTADVIKWLSLNSIQVDLPECGEARLSGRSLLSITPDTLMRKWGFTRFIAKQIVEWVEEQSNEFDLEVLAGNENDENKASRSIENIIFSDESRGIMRDGKIIAGGNRQSQGRPFWQPKFLTKEGVKLAESFLFLPNCIKLHIKGHSFDKLVSGSCKIGRSSCNQIILSDFSVSRFHASIICHSKVLQQSMYFLEDANSKFGTFVSTNQIQRGIEGSSFLLEEDQVEILSVNSKGGSLWSRQFSIILSINGREVTLQAKNLILLGSRKSCDIRIRKGFFKIWGERATKSYCIQSIQGILYKKIKPNQRYQLETKIKYSIAFGLQKCEMSVDSYCLLCNIKKQDCAC